MPDLCYKIFEQLYKELNIQLEDTDEKSKIIEANNFIATFKPQKEPIVIERR